MTTDTIGGTTSNTNPVNNNAVLAQQITASANGTLQSIGINVKTASLNIRLAIYTDTGTDVPGTLLAESASVASIVDWNDLVVTGINIVSGTKYWLALQGGNASWLVYYASGGAVGKYLVVQAFGAFPASPVWVGPASTNYFNMRMTYSPSVTGVISYSKRSLLGVGF